MRRGTALDTTRCIGAPGKVGAVAPALTSDPALLRPARAASPRRSRPPSPARAGGFCPAALSHPADPGPLRRSRHGPEHCPPVPHRPRPCPRSRPAALDSPRPTALAASTDTSMAQTILTLLNRDRAARGLIGLRPDTRLGGLATNRADGWRPPAPSRTIPMAGGSTAQSTMAGVSAWSSVGGGRRDERRFRDGSCDVLCTGCGATAPSIGR